MDVRERALQAVLEIIHELPAAHLTFSDIVREDVTADQREEVRRRWVDILLSVFEGIEPTSAHKRSARAVDLIINDTAGSLGFRDIVIELEPFQLDEVRLNWTGIVERVFSQEEPVEV